MAELQIYREVMMTKADMTQNINSIYIMTMHEDRSVLISKGRIGAQLSNTWEYDWDEDMFEQRIASKINQGFVIVRRPDKVEPTQQSSKIQKVDSKVMLLLNYIMNDANSDIQKWLDSSIGDISPYQIGDARDILQAVAAVMENRKLTTDEMIGIANKYYSTIPTVMSRANNPVNMATNLFNYMDTEFERLDQLEAALHVEENDDYLTALNNPVIEWLNPNSEEYIDVSKLIMGTQEGHQIAELYSITIPSCLERYEACDRGKNNIQLMFHGTMSEYVQHILRTGLRKPQSRAQVKSGSRFGMGIYFADHAQRSLGYAGVGKYRPLFLCDVKLGNKKIMDGSDSNIEDPGEGYDSVHGVQSYSGMDEFIVYENGQQTIRYLALMER